MSYLPLSHIAEQAVSLHVPMAVGACSWFAESLEKLGENLREVRPHLFLAVPRVWEKMQAAMEAGSWRICVTDQADPADSKTRVRHQVADKQRRPCEKMMIPIFRMEATAPAPVLKR